MLIRSVTFPNVGCSPSNEILVCGTESIYCWRKYSTAEIDLLSPVLRAFVKISVSLDGVKKIQNDIFRETYVEAFVRPILNSLMAAIEAPSTLKDLRYRSGQQIKIERNGL